MRSLSLKNRDLASLYNVKPIALRQQVKRNMERFPNDFMFQLTNEEVEIMVSQNVIPSRKHLGGYLPYAFTENGVAMLSSVLNSKRAIYVNIQIMRAFTNLRKYLSTHEELSRKFKELEQKVETRFGKQDETMQSIIQAINSLLNPPVKRKKQIGF